MGEVGLDRPIVDPQLLGRPVQQRHHVGRIGHPVAVLDPLAVLGDPAGGAQADLAHQGRRAGGPLLLAPPQRRGRQRQRRKRLAARLVLGLGRRRRAAVDGAGVAFFGPSKRRQANAAGPADGRRKPKPLDKLPPRETAVARCLAAIALDPFIPLFIVSKGHLDSEMQRRHSWRRRPLLICSAAAQVAVLNSRHPDRRPTWGA